MLDRWISSGLWLFLAHQDCVQLLWSKNGSLDSIPVKMNLARSLHVFPSYTTHKQLPSDLSVSAHVPPSVLPKLTDFCLADSLARPSFSCSLALAFIWSLHCRPCLCMPFHSCFSPVFLLTRWQDFCGLLLLELYAKCLFLALSTTPLPDSVTNIVCFSIESCPKALYLSTCSQLFIEREGIAINPSLSAFIRSQSCSIWLCTFRTVRCQVTSLFQLDPAALANHGSICQVSTMITQGPWPFLKSALLLCLPVWLNPNQPVVPSGAPALALQWMKSSNTGLLPGNADLLWEVVETPLRW